MNRGSEVSQSPPGEERRHLARSLRALRAEREAILDVLGLAAVTLRRDRDTIAGISSGAVKILGRSREVLRGRRLSSLSRGDWARCLDSTADGPEVLTLHTGSGGSSELLVWGVVELKNRLVVLLGPSPDLGGTFRPGGSTELPERSAGQVDWREFPGLVGKSRAIRKICRLIGKVAPTDSTVLVQGESGTGKEVVAKTIHAHSSRRNERLVKVNCASLPESLLESELFGHVKGAFTGALRDRRGRFAEANGGTILLDEIGSMSLSGQTRLLRVLQEKEFEPVGSSATRSVDARVIATTNVNLGRAVEGGEFRKDLFFRLAVVKILMPPLRERMEDVPLLAHAALRRFARRMGRRVEGFRPEAMQVLLDHEWPGNVRELENVVEYALVLEEGTEISRESLPLPTAAQWAGPRREGEKEPLGMRHQLEILERHIVVQALRRVNWVRKDAARQLGVDPRNLSYFLRKHDISERDRIQTESA